jgi:hypothetical protein
MPKYVLQCMFQFERQRNNIEETCQNHIMCSFSNDLLFLNLISSLYPIFKNDLLCYGCIKLRFILNI